MNFKRVLPLMRKLVLFLFFSALLLLYLCVSDSPIVERITKGEVLESIKTFFAFEQSASQEDIPSNRPSDIRGDTQDKNRGLVNNHPAKSASERREKATVEIAEGNAEDSKGDSTENSAESSIEDPHESLEVSAGEGSLNTTLEPVAEAPKRLLDLTLPQLVDDVLDMKMFKYEYKSMLPNLFTPKAVEEEGERTSFGGRILMEEGFEEREDYRLQDIRGSIEGAELTLEVKTN
jgi:hypothetical protein